MLSKLELKIAIEILQAEYTDKLIYNCTPNDRVHFFCIEEKIYSNIPWFSILSLVMILLKMVLQQQKKRCSRNEKILFLAFILYLGSLINSSLIHQCIYSLEFFRHDSI